MVSFHFGFSSLFCMEGNLQIFPLPIYCTRNEKRTSFSKKLKNFFGSTGKQWQGLFRQCGNPLRPAQVTGGNLHKLAICSQYSQSIIVRIYHFWQNVNDLCQERKHAGICLPYPTRPAGPQRQKNDRRPSVGEGRRHFVGICVGESDSEMRVIGSTGRGARCSLLTSGPRRSSTSSAGSTGPRRRRS